MLSERDGCTLDPGDVGAALCELDEHDIAMWLAMVADKPAASTAMYLRTLRLPHQRDALPIGYWAHLFVRSEHRKLMLYPQLVFTMRKAMGELGVAAIMTAMRRPAVTEGHLKLGFGALCSWPVLVKPLRPFSLLAKHKGVGFVGGVTPIGDAAWRFGQSLRPGAGGGGIQIEVQPAAVVRDDWELLNVMTELLAAAAPARISTMWTEDLLQNRLRGGVDGRPYSVVLARRNGLLVGFSVCRVATRGNDIQTGVILELVARDDDVRVLRALARASETSLSREGAEAILWLDGAGAQASGVFRGTGYRVASGETYRLIAFSPPGREPMLSDNANDWRFTFLDHDAF